jgi:SAM-dependent methyltransferase
MKTLNEVESYWKNPDSKNDPLGYIVGQEKTDFLCGQISKLDDIKKNDLILELGCNIGRNLNGLAVRGYRFLKGIEINTKCKKVTDSLFPRLRIMDVPIYYGQIERLLPTYPANLNKLVFTMAVLCHIHPDVEDIVFDNMVRISSKYIITIEDEYKVSERHCPRNYHEIFRSRGMKQTGYFQCRGIPKLGKNYVYRCFEK